MQGPERPVAFLSTPERTDPTWEKVAATALSEAEIEVVTSSSSNLSLLDETMRAIDLFIQVIPRTEVPDQGESRASLEFGTAVRYRLPVAALVQGDENTRLPVYLSQNRVTGYFQDEKSLGMQVAEIVRMHVDRMESAANSPNPPPPIDSSLEGSPAYQKSVKVPRRPATKRAARKAEPTDPLAPDAREAVGLAAAMAANAKGDRTLDTTLLMAGLLLQAQRSASDNGAGLAILTQLRRQKGDSHASIEELLEHNAYEISNLPESPLEIADYPDYSDNAKQVVGSATLFAETVGSGQAYAPHLIGCLLTERGTARPPSIQTRLKDLGFDISQLRHALYAYLGKMPEEYDSAWKVLLQIPAMIEPLSWLPRMKGDILDPKDSDYLKDRLGVEDEVNALCSVLASTALRPPLAVGLFGDWGTGKTFFMDMMQARIRDLAAKNPDDKEWPYCRRIAQINFNAWSFVDADIWAGLGAELFEQLFREIARLDGSLEALSIVALRRQELMKDRGIAALAMASAGVKAEVAQGKVDQARQKEKEATDRIEEIQQQAKQISTVDAVEAAWQTDEVQKKVKQARDRLFGAKVTDDAMKAAATIKDAGSTVFQLVEMLKWIKDERKLWHFILYGAIFGVVALAGAALLTANLTKWDASVKEAVTALTAAAGFVGPIAVRLKGGLNWLQDTKKSLEAKTDEKREVMLAPLREEKKVAEKARQEAADEADREQEGLNKANKSVSDIDEQISSLSASRMLREYIGERYASGEYQKKLGVVAAIRRDLQKLTELLSAARTENCGLPAVDRIVIYIDDLDRCYPASRVVEILQAIHLLMAFPLFTVVVGVDSRWLLNALEVHYSELLDRPSSMSNMEDDEGEDWVTTPQDYLEKIFQIPFRLRAMDARGYRDLIKHQVTVDSTPDDRPPENVHLDVTASGAVNLANSPDTGNVGADGGKPESGQQQQSIPTQVSTDAGQSTQTGDPGSGASGTATGETIPGGEKEAEDIKPRDLELKPWELEFMGSLFPFVRRPRLAKRFVNLYLLICARVTDPDKIRELSGTEEQPGEHRMVLTLLAILTGFPDQTGRVFQAIMRESGAASWASFVPQLQPQEIPGGTTKRYRNIADNLIEEREAAVWTRLHDCLRDVTAPFSQEPLHRFAKWVPAVWRYSFHTRLNPADVVVAAQPPSELASA